MIIKNANIFIDGEFVKGSISFGKTIEKIWTPNAEVELAGSDGVSASTIDDLESARVSEFTVEEIIDAKGAYLIPGLIDVHTHGAMNCDASDGDLDGIKTMARYYASEGVTSWCPTTMTLKEPELTKAVESIRDYELTRECGAKVAGIHMEGPFVSKEKCGAQNPDNLALPDIEMFNRLQAASGNLIKLITIAPELDGAVDFIKEISKSGSDSASGSCSGSVAVSVGHTTANYETAMAAFDAGADHVTHLFNAMPPLAHREPGVIGAAFDSGAYVELITDGFHIHPTVIRMTSDLAWGDLILISDSLRCAGMPDGDYELGGQMITMKDSKAYISGTNTIAGSSISLMEGLRRAVSYGINLEDAIEAATMTPALSIGVSDKVGSIEVGKAADLVLLDNDLNVLNVFIDGEPIN